MKILVALDQSERAEKMLKAALEFAKAQGGTLVLHRSFSVPAGVPPEVFAYMPDVLPSMLEKDALAGLKELSKRVPAERLAGLRVTQGIAWQQICNVAREEKVDLIVIGSHGYGGLDRVLRASSTTAIAPCSS
jgi:nucleotide-binding universal stress UspA family protein